MNGDKIPQKQSRETWMPLPFVAPDNLKNKILFALRLFLDFQVATVYPDVKKTLRKSSGDILEIGCGAQPYRHLIPQGVNYYACDTKDSERFSYKKIDGVISYDGRSFPFPESKFNMVFHTHVLEHVYDCSFFLSECYRVLRSGGRMFFAIPFAARYHYIPDDYWRFTPACLEKLLMSAGFTNIDIVAKGSDVVVAVAKTNAIFQRIIFKNYSFFIWRITARLFFGVLFALPVLLLTVLGHLCLLLKWGSSDDPLGYSVYCEK